MVRTAYRIIFSFLFIFCLLLVITPRSFAQTQQQTNPYTVPNTNPDVPQNLHTLTQSVFLEVGSSLICLMGGFDPMEPSNPCLGIDRTTGKIGYIHNGGGLVGVMGGMIAILYTPPTNSGEYMQYLASNFGIAKQTYAQGAQPCTGSLGFCGLSPLANIWKAFLNIVYVIYVILFAIIGLGIMLRLKIDPRTVMSLENQIPKVIISLILVTFSYAIAGVLIDLMYVSTYLVTNTISSIGPQPEAMRKTVNAEYYSTPIGFSNQLMKSSGAVTLGGIVDLSVQAGWSLGDTFSEVFGPRDVDRFIKDANPANSCNGINPACLLVGLINNTLFTTLQQILGWLAGWVVSILGVIVILFALIYALFNLWFQLLRAYIFILADVVLAPFWIAAGVIPGSPLGFESWIRDMLGNLAAFPTAIAIILLAKVFMTQAVTGNGIFFVPPLIGNPDLASSIAPLLGMGTLLMAPKALEMTREAFKSPQFKYTAAIGEALGAGGGTAASTVRDTVKVVKGRHEVITKPTAGGGAHYEYKGWAKSLLDKFL